ncbi:MULTISPECIES: hypothetical protein [Dolichospermum]|uniref:hypothetical protein n=1 Tax=Dolichospermum TaxID=748770 RepID=UPI001F463846|nr:MULTISPECIES: hypothetical protein [Dolichospermum]
MIFIKNAESELPILWILTPTFSSRMIAGLGAVEIAEDWVQGVYFLPNILKTAIVVIHQLPENEDTLWLRVLSRSQSSTGNALKRLCLCYHWEQSLLKFIPIQSMGTRKKSGI